MRAFENTAPPSRFSTALALAGFVGLCLLVGFSTSGITAGAVRGWYLTLARPPGTPPNWLFAPVWTTLYVLIGVSGWLVWRKPLHRAALRLWGWQLGINALWTPVFFGLHSPGLGMIVLLAMLVAVGLTIRAFAPLSRPAAWLLLPYAAWGCYAGYVNAGFLWLNGF